MPSETFDAIIIGAGQAGFPLATALANAGRKTALIEREHIGGTCVNDGCTPTKTLVASARVAYLARRAADYGVNTGPVSVDMQVVRQRKRDIVQGSVDYLLNAATNTENLSYIEGEARFTGPKAIRVQLDAGGTRALTAEQMFINVGARPAIPNIDGLDTVPYLNSTRIMELDRVPAHLLVVGGGYVGLEFGQMFRRFGSEVTIIQRGPQLLSREAADVGEAVAEIMREDGIAVWLEADTQRVAQTESGGVALTVRASDGEYTLTGSHLLVAVGRASNADSLDLEAAGIEADKRHRIHTNARLETNVPGVYALGDVKGGPAFTHISYDDFRIVRANLLEGGSATIHDRPVPYTVFIDPQLGRVGLGERQAKAQGVAYRVAKMPMSSAARAREMAETRGFMKALVGEDDRILGCAILGVDGGEVMSVLQMAMMGGVPYTAIRDGVFAHPTLTESLNNLFANL